MKINQHKISAYIVVLHSQKYVKENNNYILYRAIIR